MEENKKEDLIKEALNDPEVETQIEEISYGVEELITKEELALKLYKAKLEKRPLRVKLGVDPTAPDIHLGHTVTLRKLRRFQNLGHQVIFIIGDFTAQIGDPTGRSQVRPPLSEEEVLENARTYTEQVFKILDPERTTVVFNSRWLSSLTLKEIIKLTSLYTVARLLERDDFGNRYRSGVPIYVHEFLYPLMQAYDSVVVKADVEMGGSDQLFNLLLGREIQKHFGQQPQIAITMPLLEGLDGVRKMSKSYGNYVALNDPPQEMFGKIMSIPDSLMEKYYKLLTDLPIKEIEKILSDLKSGALHPMEAKSNLAYTIVRMYHGEEKAQKAKEHFFKVFSKREIPEDLKTFIFPSGTRLVKALVESGMVPSSSEGKRLIKQGGIYINGERINDINFELTEGEHIIKVGKRKFARFQVKR